MEIKIIFLNTNFVSRYAALSAGHNVMENAMEEISVEKVTEIFSALGYKPKYFKGEKFFRVSEKVNGYEIWFHISLKYGLVDLMFYVKKGKEFLKPCGPFSWIPDELGLAQNPRIKPPVFGSYEELREILVRAMILFEDLKTEFSKL